MEEAADEKAYVLVRLYAEMGALHYKHWQETGTWPEASPSTQEMVDEVLHYVTPDVLPLSPQEAGLVAQYAVQNPSKEGQLPPELRRGDVVFRSREALVEGLNTVAPGTAAKIKAVAPDADGWGLEPWAVALSTGGALATVGRLVVATTPGGRIATAVSLIAGILLMGAAASFGLSAKTESGKNIVAATVATLGDAALAAGNVALTGFRLLVYGLAGAAIVGGGVAVYVYARRASEQKKLARRERRALDEAGVVDAGN